MIQKSVAVAGTNPDALSAVVETQPSEQEIAVRAHELYEKRGGEAGRDVEDWLQAERELKAARKG